MRVARASLRSTRSSYGLVTVTLHWLLAVLLTGLFFLGWYMTGLGYYDRWYQRSFGLHEGLGLVALILGVGRIAWVLADTRPALVPGLRSWERIAARATHVIFYAMLVLIPASGYLISTADGRALDVFGLVEVPALATGVVRMEEVAGAVHYYLAFGTAWLVLLHTLAALKHHFVNHDATLSRMFNGSHRSHRPSHPGQPEQE